MRRRDSGCPIPPLAPRTATLVFLAAVEENILAREWALSARAACLENIL